MAVSGFVIEAIRKRVSSRQPTPAISTEVPVAIPATSAGTSHASAAASQRRSKRLENGESIGNPLPY